MSRSGRSACSTTRAEVVTCDMMDRPVLNQRRAVNIVCYEQNYNQRKLRGYELY